MTQLFATTVPKSGAMIFVAEIGSNHKGIKSLAFEMIRQAAASGADIAKFQLGRPGDDPIRGIDEWAFDLEEYCFHFGIEFMASLWTRQSFDLAQDVGMKRYKLAHQMKDPAIIAPVWESGKEVFHSGVTNGVVHQNVMGIYCQDKYPLYPRDLKMPDRFSRLPGEHYGYSSHMHGFADALIAIARGAQYIEKHVTLDKTEESIKDNSFALSFDEFAEMVRVGREIGALL